ncbi:LOW QUALITY PROTEIN: transforming acidic coiled-coil-containing protein 3-like [Bubalus bubalis]|uniref:LOW QUALITY PROTEIN: transforming acidic coiled-coil-containing protein 3-like n=1 Tax=Bubalus bubalis TaxID=89462 RepID=UPI001D118DF3|nr:LOW QUALITY PROTEIN: transforming acidic coiled-coil-containing protein 3-like [Bubalus bubalis]
MSRHIFSDENVTGDKSTENCDFLFSPPELTGRSSVLHLSQKENVPPKSTAKTVKVTFQTPLWDPQTYRILSPSVGSKLEACFVLGDPTELENCHQVCTQKENQQFTKETDTKTTHGILQKPVPVNTEPPSEDMRPVSEDQPPGGPPSAPLVSLGPSSSSQIPESVENPEASRGPAPGSPECTQEEHVHPWPSEESMPLGPVAPEQPPGVASQDTAEDPLSATGGDLEGIPGPPARPASPCGAPPGEKPLVDLPGAALAGSMDATGREDTALTGPGEAAGATHPGAQGEEACGQATGSLRSGPVRLEFDFSDATGKRSPPLQKRGKALGLKPPSRRPEVRPGKATLEAGKGGKLALHESDGPSWDKPDNPDCNPAADSGEARPPEHPQSGQATEALSLSRQACSDDTPGTRAPARTPGAAGEGWTTGSSGGLAPLSSPSSEPLTAPTNPTPPTERGPEPTLDLNGKQFWDPAEVLGAGAEVDYLEQFGASSFKESALRKQSLYLNFDPLLQDSPWGLAPSSSGRPRGLPVPSAGPLASEESPGLMQMAGGFSLRARSVDGPSSGSPREAQLLDLDFPGAPGIPIPGPAPCDLGPGAAPLPVERIVDVLQYSQKDLDSAVEATQKENEVLRGKCAALQERLLEIGKIMDSFEGTVYQVMEESQKQKELTKAEMQKVLKEKAQLTADLHSMEKSFSDLFKRFEKQKEVIEGYRTNEESLKKCVEDYIERVEKEAQKYQALKAQAEEKLRQASEEIAQVRSKAQTDALALQAVLRKEQMRVHSLEKVVEQKTKENDELTRICDDLISKMKRI